ncbi:MAG: hypothetical protein GX121_06910 [Ignavibacteria bacterium]|nr:hypothetical protein [Ignavibacteria bacterium]
MQKAFNQNIIDISILPNAAKTELLNYFEYLLFRYRNKNISNFSDLENLITPNESITNEYNENITKNEFLAFLKKGFTISEDEFKKIEDTQKEINQWKIESF